MTVNKQLDDAPTTIAIARLRLIACRALAWELLAIINQLPPDVAELTCLPAESHDHLEKIVPGIKSKDKAARKAGFNPAVIFGNYGTGGKLGVFLDEENVVRTLGQHCYHSFMREADFDPAMDQEFYTFFITDNMVRYFERIVMKGMGIRQHPELRNMYFGHYTRVLYIAQTDCKRLRAKAVKAAAELGLDYEYRYAGYGEFVSFIRGLPRHGGGVKTRKMPH